MPDNYSPSFLPCLCARKNHAARPMTTFSPNPTSDMKQIETLIFDYGGVIVNIDDAPVTQALADLGISRIEQLIHARKIKKLMRQFIDGLVPTAQTLVEMQQLCRKGTTVDEIIEILDQLCGDLPKSRLEMLAELRKKYKVYLLSNICDLLWEKSEKQMISLGFNPKDCFDDFFLSYRMNVAKPDSNIYQQMINATGLVPENALYFDDREENYKAGKALGFQSVLVKTNRIEDTEAWKQLVSNRTPL